MNGRTDAPHLLELAGGPWDGVGDPRELSLEALLVRGLARGHEDEQRGDPGIVAGVLETVSTLLEELAAADPPPDHYRRAVDALGHLGALAGELDARLREARRRAVETAARAAATPAALRLVDPAHPAALP